MLLSWCGWHMQVLRNFMEMLTWACYEAFVTVVEEKGATATNPKMMPRQHIGSSNSIEIPVQKRNVRMCGTRKRWWGAPGYRVPTGQRRCQTREQLTFTGGYNIQTCISYNTCIHPRVNVSAVTPSKCANGTVRVRCNVEEVDVLGTVVVEVVVHESKRK